MKQNLPNPDSGAAFVYRRNEQGTWVFEQSCRLLQAPFDSGKFAKPKTVFLSIIHRESLYSSI